MSAFFCPHCGREFDTDDGEFIEIEKADVANGYRSTLLCLDCASYHFEEPIDPFGDDA